MAVAVTNRLRSDNATGASSFSTASWTPPSNNLVFACVYSRTAITTNPNQPTASGNGLTWVVVNSIVFDTTSSSRRRITIFRAMGSSPSTGATTFDFGGQTQTGASWIVDTFTGMDTGGTNGSAAVVQSVTNKDEPGGTTLTVTLAAFGSSSNATYGFFASADGNATNTAGSGFTEVAEWITNSTEVGVSMATEFRADNDTSVDYTWSTSGGQYGGIAVEIAVPSAGTSVKDMIGGFIPFAR